MQNGLGNVQNQKKEVTKWQTAGGGMDSNVFLSTDPFSRPAGGLISLSS